MTTKPSITQTSRTKTPTTLPSAIDRSERGARSRAKLPPKTSRKAPPSPPTLSASLLSPLVSPQSKHKKDSQRPWDAAHFLDTRNGGGSYARGPQDGARLQRQNEGDLPFRPGTRTQFNRRRTPPPRGAMGKWHLYARPESRHRCPWTGSRQGVHTSRKRLQRAA